jgi:hypothetical protein
MGNNLMSNRKRHATLERARETTRRQISQPEIAEALAGLRRAVRPEKVRRPDGPPSDWPAQALADLSPGAPVYETG